MRFSVNLVPVSRIFNPGVFRFYHQISKRYDKEKKCLLVYQSSKKFPFIARFLFHPFASILWFLIFASAVKLNRLASCPLLTEGRSKLGHLLSPLVAFPRYPTFRPFRLFRNLYVSKTRSRSFSSNFFFSLLISVSFPFVISVGYLVACNCSSRTCTSDRNGGTPEYNIEFL